MRVIGFAVVLALGFALVPVEAHTQQAGKVYRVGYLYEGSASAELPAIGLDGLRRGLRALGWTEGGNLVIEARFAEGKREQLAGLAADLIRLNVDVIVAAPNTPTALAAKKATTTVPIVMTARADPVAAGLVASFAKPGGNVTGVAALNTDVVGKRIQIFLEAVPGISEIGVLVRLDNPGGVQNWEMANAAGINRPTCGFTSNRRSFTPSLEVREPSLRSRTSASAQCWSPQTNRSISSAT
jgi:putative tryptophan/tyrosine transport system substrate-binding protein